jgi:hypothetical protein
MIYQTKSTEFGEFCRSCFGNLNFSQILSENLTEKHRNSRISPISLRTGKKLKPKSKSLATTGRLATDRLSSLDELKDFNGIFDGADVLEPYSCSLGQDRIRHEQ